MSEAFREGCYTSIVVFGKGPTAFSVCPLNYSVTMTLLGLTGTD